AAYVLAQGHRRILALAFESSAVGQPDKWRGTLARRLAGLKDALDEAGLNLTGGGPPGGGANTVAKAGVSGQQPMGGDLGANAGDGAASDPGSDVFGGAVGGVAGVQLCEVPNTRAAGADALREAWGGTSSRPTAVLAFSDVLALGALSAAHELGVDVPGQLSVTGFDDIAESQWFRPGLTTVRQPIETNGRLAAEYLVEAVGAGGGGLHRHRLQTTLVLRDSTAPPPL
ncbi:MAG: substrate-binding domain-containing protein, partial [Bifidobacteriaceae bacterium]|nr:substrate-binding domain-containing protein [Bifidobacteriaceae bacterium]